MEVEWINMLNMKRLELWRHLQSGTNLKRSINMTDMLKMRNINRKIILNTTLANKLQSTQLVIQIN